MAQSLDDLTNLDALGIQKGNQHYVVGLDGSVGIRDKSDPDPAKFVRPPCGEFGCSVEQNRLQRKIMRLTARLLHIHSKCESAVQGAKTSVANASTANIADVAGETAGSIRLNTKGANAPDSTAVGVGQDAKGADLPEDTAAGTGQGAKAGRS